LRSVAIGYGREHVFYTFFVHPLVNDALDDIMADSDDEEEEDAIVNKVLDEIGIEISGKVSGGEIYLASLSKF
jgi:hypothetical protein